MTGVEIDAAQFNALVHKPNSAADSPRANRPRRA